MTDSPKVFNLDAVEGETNLDPFRFTFAGLRIELPHMASIPPFETFRRVQKYRSEQMALIDLIMERVGPEAAGKIERLNRKQVEALIQAWMDHSGVEPGELQASSSS